MNTAAVKEKYAVFITTSERTMLTAMVNLLSLRHQEDAQLAKRSFAHLEHPAALRSLVAKRRPHRSTGQSPRREDRRRRVLLFY
jgi:hypothetical protein